MERKLQLSAAPAVMKPLVGEVPGVGGANSINIQRLFHGTKKVIVDAICQQGFDWRLNGSAVDTLYGKGSYFAKKAKYSAGYTDCRTMFLVQVLVGAYTLGSTTMVLPPPKDVKHSLVDLYDSCVDNVADPNIFVVFTPEQSYSEYLIEY